VCGPLHVGKLDRQGRLNDVVPGSLVHIVDQLSNRRFLVDTGVSYSIFPHTSAATPSGPKLRGAAGQLIPCWGEKTFDLSFQGRHFSWTFLLAAVSFPIIGVDFLRHFKLMVDPAANALVDKCSRESFAMVSTLTAAATVDSGPPPAAQPAALLSYRPPQSPASSVTGLLSQRPLLSAVPVRWPPRRRERTAMHSCWWSSRRWSTALGGCLGNSLGMWSITLLPGDRHWPAAFADWTAKS
jgi:hypothetical protein